MKLKPTLLLLFVLLLVLAVPAAAAQQTMFGAVLKGENEVPPVETDASGKVMFLDETTQIRFRLRVRNIMEATAGHIHCAPVGVIGPVGVTLFTGESFSGNFTVRGTITAPDAGNGCGWEDLADIRDAIETGNAYVNVHTVAHPGGEIRGQVMALP